MLQIDRQATDGRTTAYIANVNVSEFTFAKK